MRPFFSYYGGKWRAARHYPAPQYDVVIEPFAGAAGYSTWYAVTAALLADRDPAIANTWDWLIRAEAPDLLALPDVGNEEVLADLKLGGAEDLVGFWCGMGASHPARSPWAAMRKFRDRNPNSYWGPGVRSRLAEQVSQIKRWGVLRTHYRTLPNFEATWFVDPPYAGRPGSHYTYGSGGIDYADLADWCRSRRGQVIVCEAQGADWLPFVPLGTFKANATSVGRRSAEAIWLAQHA